MALKKLGTQIWMPILMITWGTILAATSAVKTGPQLITARFFLGLASGGSQPGTIYYASLWFTRRDLSARLAIFYTGSGNIAGAYGIVHLDGARGLAGWQWLFIIEALPAIVLGVLFYVLLPEGPETAKFLNARERKIVVDRLAADNSGDDQEKGVSWDQFREVFRDWKTYAFILRCIRMFLPIIIRGFGFDRVLTQAMTAPPYLASTIASILYCCSSDHFKERGLHIVAGAIVSLIAFALLIALRFSAAAGLYVCVCIGVSGVCCVVCVRTAWVSNNYGGKTKRAVALAVITATGGIGSPLGGQFYRADDAPHYHPDYRYFL
ncbi:major facilitator superfamily domain-containing protein [Zychaea mexicana]|uniref:major facilitator superfamily domain-containing protein n=1 Tax=Zychaea mexicana TaxID=64656 RepID=UPI0022FEADAA|nr:major facilitator superfamily domain-containing protein [Zychaea mexicana]KAI9497448.1 major facilitator superfamily domain-containing protein [Zychaea mexicana]